MKSSLKHIMSFLIRGIFLIGISAALASCSGDNKEAETEKEESHEEGIVELSDVQYKTAGVQLGGIEQRQIAGLLKVNGLLDVPPQNQVSISVPYGGILKDTDLLQGMWVTKGSIIARMEHPDYIQMQQDYLDAYSQLGFMEQEYKRQEELSKENVTAAKTFQKASADYSSLKIRVEALTQKLAMLNVQADRIRTTGVMRSIPLVTPISGYVTEVNANIGKFVQPNEVIFEIVDTRHLHVELMVFEKDVPRLKEGQKVRFTLANESRERLADVHLIGREISPDRTVRVHCHLNDEDKDLLPGMYLKATIESGGSLTDALPSEAIVNSGGKNYFFIQTDDTDANDEHRKDHEDPAKRTDAAADDHKNENEFRFRMIEVSTGVSDNGYTEITLPDGFDPGAKNIVLKGAYDLISKMNNSEEEGHGH